ncbi:hypothetical protein [Citricoccus nitrophenolicus]|uniref:hypothetical protein n=1 Tax=Citricoccus nitrophenolicus TaxID=863575 RepID=UPI0039B3AFC0
MTDFTIDVGPFNGVVNGVESNLEDFDSAEQLVTDAADDLVEAAKDSDLIYVAQQLRDETLTVLADGVRSAVNSAITGARGARDAYLEFDSTVVSETPDQTGG